MANVCNPFAQPGHCKGLGQGGSQAMTASTPCSAMEGCRGNTGHDKHSLICMQG